MLTGVVHWFASWFVPLVLLMATASAAEPAPEVAVHISHGPVLGRLGSDSVGVWARTSQPAVFHIRYGTNERELNSRSATVPSIFIFNDHEVLNNFQDATVQMNNVFDSPNSEGQSRWVAFEKPQVVVQFYNASTGRLLYAESVLIETQAVERR